MYYFIVSLLSIIPALISIIHIKKIDKNYKPLVYTIWLSVIVEICVRVSKLVDAKNLYFYFYNVFSFFNFLFLLFMFFRLKIIKTNVFFILLFLFCAINILEALNIEKFKLLTITNICSNVLLIILSINTISSMLFIEYKNLFRSNVFLIGVAILLLSLFDILNTILGWLFPLSIEAIRISYFAFSIANIIYYLILSFVFLCLHQNKK